MTYLLPWSHWFAFEGTSRFIRFLPLLWATFFYSQQVPFVGNVLFYKSPLNSALFDSRVDWKERDPGLKPARGNIPTVSNTHHHHLMASYICFFVSFKGFRTPGARVKLLTLGGNTFSASKPQSRWNTVAHNRRRCTLPLFPTINLYN